MTIDYRRLYFVKVVIFDLDAQEFIQDPGFEFVLPDTLYAGLKNSLHVLKASPKKGWWMLS